MDAEDDRRKDKPAAADAGTSQRLGRRLLVLRLATPVAAAAAVVSAAPAQAQRYTGLTDRDPSDSPGYGRGARTGISDADPSDPPGGGRGRPRTGISDADPTDPPGGGRGRPRTGLNDSDPSDPPGGGRRGW